MYRIQIYIDINIQRQRDKKYRDTGIQSLFTKNK